MFCIKTTKLLEDPSCQLIYYSENIIVRISIDSSMMKQIRKLIAS